MKKTVATSTTIRLMRIVAPVATPPAAAAAAAAGRRGRLDEQRVVGDEDEEVLVVVVRLEGVGELDVLDGRLVGRRRVEAHLVEVDLRLRGARLEEAQLAVVDEAGALGERVALRHLVEVVGGGLGEVGGDDDAEVAVAEELVVVDLRRARDLAERDVDLAEEDVLLVARVGVELLQQLERLRARREVLVDKELGAALEDELLHLEPRDRVGRVRLVTRGSSWTPPPAAAACRAARRGGAAAAAAAAAPPAPPLAAARRRGCAGRAG